MKFATAVIVALGLMAGTAQARSLDGPFTDINQSAPRSVFEQVGDTAPRQPFDRIQDTAPRATSLDSPVDMDLVGE